MQWRGILSKFISCISYFCNNLQTEDRIVFLSVTYHSNQRIEILKNIHLKQNVKISNTLIVIKSPFNNNM